MEEKLKVKYEFRPNTIYCGNNEVVLEQFIKQYPDGVVDLIYIDPPFFSNRNYEIIWKDGYELLAYKDRWKGGIEHYIGWMRPKIEFMKRILKPTGSFYLHCDYHASHYLKVMCDKIFDNNFRNEIIWRYKRWTNVSNEFQKMHDVLLFYTKGDEYTFNTQYRKLEGNKSGYNSNTYKKSDGTRVRQLLIYDKDKYNRLVEKGKINPDEWDKITFATNRRKPYDDIWDIPIINPMAKERLGYPTQKPEKLLEQVIKASSNKGDIVADFFCGCGTALAVAKKLNRRFIGIDVSPLACDLTADRIGYSKLNIVGMKYTIPELKNMNHFTFQYWAVRRIGGIPTKRKTGDKGIDGLVDTAYGNNVPIEVKQHNISRPDVDKFETVIKRTNKKAGYMIAFKFSKGAIEEMARFKREEGLKIIPITVEDLFKNEPEKYKIATVKKLF
ncbi:hypothetical protein LCGC14_2162360 [marine sediment metagenome]|uniref:DNA methylase N-4/N-6 domain-containing protein n=1 Tax=marine sediment metagenome TaxID=412755 RepID=A0A0F9DSG0_9ZZZZ